MILVAGGDSFIYGAELADQINGPSSSTYPALLAQQYNMDYICSAWSGNANNAISRLTLSECQQLLAQNKKFAVIITWTFTQRFEFRFNYNTNQKQSPWYSINSWTIEDDAKNILSYFKNKNKAVEQAQIENINIANRTGVADFARAFYKHVGDSEYYELYTSLKEIVFMQNYLKLNNIPYLFIPADTAFFQHENYNRSRDTYIDDLYNQIDWSSWYFFPEGTKANETQGPRGFYQWAVENNYSIGTTHPLEDAHSAAADLIKEKFNELVAKIN